MLKYITTTTICLIQLQTMAAEPISALDLLDKYAQTQDKLQRSIIKSQDSCENVT